MPAIRLDLLVAAAGFLSLQSAVLAQTGRPVQSSNPWNNHVLAQAIYWLTNDQMVGELGILPEQKEKLDKLRTDMQTKTTEAYKSINFNEIKPEERTNKYYEVMNKVSDETAKEVEKILLPHQIKRLKQIMTQTRLQQLGYGGGAAVLGGDDLASELGITDQQLEELKKKEEEVRQEIQKKSQEFYKKLQEESREKIFSVLTPKQRRKLDELIGERFEWKYQQPAAGQGGAGVVEKPAEKK